MRVSASLTDFGANYNLTVNDMTKRGMNVGRLAPALFTYFLQPPCVTGVFPFLQPTPFETTYMGQTIKEVTFGGVLACLPVLVGASVRFPHLEAAYFSALDAHNHGRHCGADCSGRHRRAA